ncbi:semaphorin-3C [Hippocampus zosterae]|uniref:semaphorin-3C n=1 Tax=Hippocampus zosterae TaxID=109293 RepID=UPI00223CF35A|nr:semaphorin-3C [Hippocampus zosterae]XP_051911384.1 semaphorin-3C [Hippocampus zosterae]XP_051911385.1 semaphorin-3C [Hippocampus zosterae]
MSRSAAPAKSPAAVGTPPLLLLLALLLSRFSQGVGGLPQPLPRVFLSFDELQNGASLDHYALSDKPMDYRILHVDEDQDRMYVGCKDHVLSMDINNITHATQKVFWPASTSKIEECQMAGKDPTHGCGNFVRVVQPYNRTHLFVCGSGAYSPVCVYVNRGRRPEEQTFHIDSRSESGKGRCSFNPRVNTVSIMLNQELFSGMYIDFMGTDAAIFRSLTKRNAVRTDQHNSKWLSEPIFVDAHLIPDGTDPNDAKLYFFLRERLTDNNGNTRNIHSMVARVCPSDIGGQRSMVNKWTTYLKARMVCSVLEEDGTETHFDELESVFLLESEHPKGLLVFGVFTSTSSVFKGSAVCVYNMADILTVFNGPFAHRDGPNFQWVAFQGRIPYPRPGTCPGGAFTPDIRTTKEFPDDVVNFVRNHPVMFNPIYPVGRRPLVVRTGADYKYTAVAVDQVAAADGNYQVLFLGTDKGSIQKVIALPTNQSLHKDLILEELQVFQNEAPVTNLRISSKKQQLYVSSELGVSQVSLHRCHAYGAACADCCLARDPYCAWDGHRCSRFYPSGKRRSRRQDVMHGNPLTQCRGFNLKAYRNAAEMTQYGVRNNTTFLECLPKSPQASVRWLIHRDDDRRKEVKLSERVLSTEHGLLIRSAQLSDQGLYYCLTTENGFKRTVAKIRLRVLSAAAAGALSERGRSPWPWSAGAPGAHPKALLEAFSPAENLAVQQYCKERKERKELQEKQKSVAHPPPGPLRGDLAKLKPLLDRRKSRHRRNHLPED